MSCMMRTRYYVLGAVLGLVALIAPGAVRADTIVFDASGTFAGGASLTGTVTIDTTNGLVTAESLATTGALVTGPFAGVSNQGDTGTTPNYYYFFSNVESGYAIALVFTQSTLVGYNGGTLCGFNGSANCQAAGSDFITVLIPQAAGGDVDLTQGQLQPQSTPEPSSFSMLLTGGLGLLGISTLRRKRLGLA